MHITIHGHTLTVTDQDHAEALFAKAETFRDNDDTDGLETWLYDGAPLEAYTVSREAAGVAIKVSAEAEQSGGTVAVWLDGIQYERETLKGDNWGGATFEAESTAERVAEMLEAGMLRRVGDAWELAENATHPVPAGFVAEWGGAE